ncbi:MAG: hypothetical protein LUF85_06085 [Bacteroides sp.]|nr:hypothetical protein [Bacteroides sp.]
MRTEFPAGITIRWNFGGFESGGKGSCFIYFDYFLTADTGWLKSWFKKIVSIADYSDQVAALTELDEYLVFNIDRLTTETKETFPEKKKTETRWINLELTAQVLELTALKERRKETRHRDKEGKFYYDSSAPSKFEIGKVETQIKNLKKQLRNLETEEKKLTRTLKSCKTNEALVRERLEVIKH